MEDLDLKELFSMFWNKKIQIILIVAIFAVIGLIYTIGFVTPVYTSSTTLLLATSAQSDGTSNTITTTDLTLNSKLVATYSKLVESKNVIRQVIQNLGISDLTENELRNNVSVSSVEDTEIIKISVTNKNATYAAKAANEIANVFSKEVVEIYNINNVHVIDEAEVEQSPSNVNHIRDIVIFAFVGAVIAVMYVLISNMLDTTIKTAEDVEKYIKIPVLASIPVYSVEEERKPKKKGGKR